MNKKYKLIYINDIAYAISDEEINIGEYQIYNPVEGEFITKGKISKAERNLSIDGRRAKVLFTSDKSNTLGLPVFELPNKEVDVKELALSKYCAPYRNANLQTYAFIAGYQQANKGYSEEDLRKAIERARTSFPKTMNHPEDGEEYELTEDEIIQSLKKRPTSIIIPENYRTFVVNNTKYIYKDDYILDYK